MIKKFICIGICLIQIVVLFCGCGIIASESESIPFKTETSHVPSGVIAQKGEFSLEWNAERCSLAILKGDDVVWASMPIDQYENNTKGGAVKKHIESHLLVDYKDESTNSVTSVVSYIDAFEDGRVYSYLVNDGIRILYCFDKQCFAIPVIYQLRDGYLEVMIENSKIYECGNEIYEISVLPYSCGVENSKKNRIFVPDGSGMIMNCDSDREKRSYSADIYGEDGAETSEYKFIYEETAHLPVFAIGSKANGSYCTIINEGAASASINAVAGDGTIGYSYAYPSFKIRGSETVQIPQGWGNVSITGQYSDISRSSRMQMRIAFLDEYDSDFSNVAEYYQNYLVEEKGLKKKGEEKLLYLDIPMAISQREFLFGFPRNVMQSITTYDQTLEIINDIITETDVKPLVRLSGIQSGGLEVTKIAGGFKTEKVLGNKKSLNNLISNAKKLGVELFPDFDITRFKDSSSGFNVKSDSIKSATSRNASQYFYSVSTGAMLENEYTYYLLTPTKLYSASQKLLEKTKNMKFENISLSTLGNGAYSDYEYEKGYVGGDYLKVFDRINKTLSKSKVDVMYDSADEFSAVYASYIINSPTRTSNYNAQDEWIPFYQMVFKGYIPMASESVNLAEIDREELLRAVQCGIGVSFTVCGDETLDYSTSKFPQLLAGSYENAKDLILDTVKEIKEVSNNYTDTTIVNFKMISDGVYQTDFSNGKSVVVNYTDTDYDYNDTLISSMNYKFF